MPVTMDGHARFYPASIYPRDFGSSIDGNGHHSHAFISSPPPACYYACGQGQGGFGGQAMSVVEQEPQHMDSVHPAFSPHHHHHHQPQLHPLSHHHQPRCYGRAQDSHSPSGLLHHPCTPIQQAHHNSPLQPPQHPHLTAGAHLQHPTNVDPEHREAAHSKVPSLGPLDPLSATPVPAHLNHPAGSVSASLLDRHGLTATMHPNEPPPAHSQGIGPTSPAASIHDSDIDQQQQQQQHHNHHQQHQQPLPFPWMKTTKSHAHQWKAQWPDSMKQMTQTSETSYGTSCN
ncbi:hypothetical protein Btru_064855 [Bulinus truncatus]|nr:hypothetical protein Btru_064855 [Bulinus truncatus]